ncbi:MAG: sensor histidine kinase [Thermodesulfobacteriota bacterium]
MFDFKPFSHPSKQPDIIESPTKPLQTALVISAVFFAAGIAYILLSSHIAALFAASVPDLATIEKIKGIIYVVVTTILLFGLLYGQLLRIQRQQRKLLNFGNRLIDAERQATAGVFADSVAGEISNVLMTMEYNINILVEGKPEEKQAAMANINRSQARLNSLARRLGKVGGSRAGQTKQDYFDLSAALKDAIDFAGKHQKLRSCALEFRGPDSLMFMGNPLLIYQMLINLALNAADATGGHGHIRVGLSQQADSVAIRVHDNGPGVSENRRKSILEPFATSKEKGLGLGLLSVTACARAHQGSVSVGESDLGGACFEVFLKKTPPVIDDAAA